MTASHRRFEFAFATAYRRFARTFLVTPETAWVEVDDETFEARFGRWHVRTPLTNIVDVDVTGPYAFWKTAGPARLAVTDRGLTFATNGDRGVLISFQTPVRGLDPLGVIHHRELTVTVADVDGLADLLRTRASIIRPLEAGEPLRRLHRTITTPCMLGWTSQTYLNLPRRVKRTVPRSPACRLSMLCTRWSRNVTVWFVLSRSVQVTLAPRDTTSRRGE